MRDNSIIGVRHEVPKVTIREVKNLNTISDIIRENIGQQPLFPEMERTDITSKNIVKALLKGGYLNLGGKNG
jgi:hypothetical protein